MTGCFCSQSPPWRRHAWVAFAVFVGLAPAFGVGLARAQTSATNASAVKPPIVPPVLVHFEPAAYPVEAAEAGLEAIVVLRLDIDTEGQVTDVQVSRAAGHGFDEAAAAAARHFAFTAAKRGELPVASRILYQYSFKLSPPPNEHAHPSPALKKTGELRGVLLGGAPPVALAGAQFHVRSESSIDATIITDKGGGFVVPNLAAGDYAVEISLAGYEPVRLNEHVAAGEATVLKYILTAKDASALEVTVRGTAVHREVTHYELTREELLRVPGTLGDAVHAVEAMPSVARAPAFSGDLIVRGSAPDDTQVFVEGTLVPRVFHYGSLSSVIPSEMIENLEFYPGNFSVRYGRGMGGIVDVGLRLTNPDGKFHGSAQMDFINVRANVEGPLPFMHGWSFMAGVRVSYVDRWLVPVLRSSGSAIQGIPRYDDYQMYIERKLPNHGVLRLGFFGAQDQYIPIDKNPTNWLAPTDAFGHFQALLRLPLSSDVALRASWSMGRDHSVSLGDDGRMNSSTVNLGTARVELSANTGTFGIARVGGDLLYAPYTVGANTDVAQSGGELASTQTGSPSLRQVDLHGVFLRPATFAEYEFAPNHRTNVTAGLRLDYTKDTDEVDLAPRISARYAVLDKPFSPIVKGGIGEFYQPPQPGQTLPELGAANLRSELAMHSMLGIEQPLSKQVSVSVEGFEKEMRRLIVTRVDGSGNTVTENSGTGRVIGVDLLLRYRPDSRFFGWVAYTVSRSTRRLGPDEPTKLFIYDETHVLNVLGSYKLGRGWELGARFRYMTGFLYNACFGGLFDNSTGAYRCYGTTTQNRLAPFHQLDLRIEKTWWHPSFKWSAYLDVINAYFHNSPDYAVPNYDYSAVKPLSLSLPLLPSIGVRGEF